MIQGGLLELPDLLLTYWEGIFLPCVPYANNEGNCTVRFECDAKYKISEEQLRRILEEVRKLRKKKKIEDANDNER